MVPPEYDLCDLVPDGATSPHQLGIVLQFIQLATAVDKLIIATEILLLTTHARLCIIKALTSFGKQMLLRRLARHWRAGHRVS